MRVTASTRSFIGAGLGNSIDALYGVIGGGRSNNLGDVGYSVIAGGGGSGEGNSIIGSGPEASFIGAGKNNTIDSTAGSQTLGEIRTEDVPETGSAPTPPMKHQHIITGGFTNLILNSGGVGGELGFIGGGAYNEINDSEGEWHGNAILAGFNNLIEANRYNTIVNGFENQGRS